MMKILLLLSIAFLGNSAHRVAKPAGEDAVPCKIKFVGPTCPVGRRSCEESSDCTGGLVCCNDGCGNTCRNNTILPQQPASVVGLGSSQSIPPIPNQPNVPQCPAVTIRYTFCRFTTYRSCTGQADCSQNGMLCCPDVCGRKCKYPVNPAIEPVQTPVRPAQRPVPATKIYKGTCPVSQPYNCQSTPILYYCGSDSNCMTNERCCFDNCNYICKRVAVAKLGYCPVPPSDPTLRCNYYDKCYDDGDCSQNRKCCDHPCGKMCVEPVEQKNGVCQNYVPNNGYCYTTADMCHNDYECQGDMKCCQYQCGNRCQNPALANVPRPEYVCPPKTTYICVRWQNECRIDRDCPFGKKCCNTGCGNACLRPTTFIYSA